MTSSRLSLTVQYASNAAGLPTRTQLRRWLRVALQRRASMTLRIVDEAEGHALNKAYRGKDYATNVLTFVYDDMQPFAEAAPPEDDALYGDVIICAPVVEREAASQHKTVIAHYAHLVVHAALHLQGYDHESDADAVLMEALESKLMLELRFPDPYQSACITNE